MNNIIVNFQPFDALQTVIVYQQGAVVATHKASIDDIPNLVLNLSTMYSCKNVNLVGNKNFLERTKAQILTKFANKDLNIEIIERG